MTTASYSAAMRFHVSRKMEGKTTISSILPSAYADYQLPHAEVQYCEGPFGCYFTQEIKDKRWLIGWLRGFFSRRLTLLPRSSLPMVAIVCVIEGNVPCFLTGVGRLLLQQGKIGLYYVPPGAFNEAKFDKKVYNIVYFSIAEEYLAEFIDMHPQFDQIHDRQLRQAERGEALPMLAIGPRIMDILDSLQRCNEYVTPCKVVLHSKITELLILYYTTLVDMEKTSCRKWDNMIRQMADYIQAHYADQLTIQSLARIAGMNTDTFTREFKRLYKQTPWDFLLECRIQQATALLLRTDDPIMNIGANVGFTDIHYFSNAFKKRCGYSPSQYRRKWESSASKG